MDTKEILERVDKAGFYARHIDGFQVNGRAEIMCRCPFHVDTNPSLSVNVETGLYNCFSCGGGDPITFLQKLYDLSFPDALERLTREEGIDVEPKKEALTKKEPVYLTRKQIERLHQQLIDNPDALKMFQEKYGLSLDTIEERLLGYQNSHFVIPMQPDPGKDKWHFKEHKGLQSRGAKATLYPNDILKRDHKGTIVITEGEFKALLLIQNGFDAVSGTAGANTWKREWNERFKGLDVAIAYDNDDPGKEGALKVWRNLNGAAKSVRAVKWPSEMNTKELKDVTDYFLKMGKTREDFQRLVDAAEEMGPPIKELHGIRHIEPEDFKIEKGCVKGLFYSKEGTTYKVISYSPLFITERALDVDTGTEEDELTFMRDGKLTRVWVTRRQLHDAKKLIELADIGLPVNSSNSRYQVQYFTSYEAANMGLIRRSLICKGVGWKEVGGKNLFILNSRLHWKGPKKDQDGENGEATVEFIAEPGFERFVKAFQPQGTFQKWKEAVIPTLKYDDARFALYASFAAPLLKPLKAPNFIIDYHGQTSLGKTTVLELASSVWGNPHKEAGGLVFSWDSTKVFLERIANFFCDVPIFPDDSQTVDDRTLVRMLYMVANGVGKGRGSITGIRQTPTWHTVCFSTGEKALTECTEYGGAGARTIGIHGSPFPNAGGEFINTMKQGIRENYGHAGPKFIEGLLPILEDQKRFERIRSRYLVYQRIMSDQAKTEKGDRVSYYFATVKIAADLVHEILAFDDPGEIERSIYRVFCRIIQDSSEEGDTAKRAMEYVAAWICDHKSYFTENNKDCFGAWIEGEYVGISPLKIKEVLNENGFSVTTSLKAWNDRGWIIKDDGHFTTNRRVKMTAGFSSETRRMVVFPWGKFKEFI